MVKIRPSIVVSLLFLAAAGPGTCPANAQVRYPLPYPPTLAGDKKIVAHRTAEFLKPGPNRRDGVEIARTAPLVEFMYYPGQDYPGNPWCFRGVGCVRDGKYYSALCDHRAPRGTAMLYEYDDATKQFRLLVNTAKFLRSAGQITPHMNYSPGEVQTRIEFGSDGWLYYGTTRGSTRETNDANGFEGEWVLRTEPKTGKTEVVCAFPVPKHCILASVLDRERGELRGQVSLFSIKYNRTKRGTVPAMRKVPSTEKVPHTEKVPGTVDSPY